MSARIDGRYETRYSERLSGNVSNHERAVRFDYSPNGYIGITAFESEKDRFGDYPVVADRVLLTPAQTKALIAFAQSRGRSTKPKK